AALKAEDASAWPSTTGAARRMPSTWLMRSATSFQSGSGDSRGCHHKSAFTPVGQRRFQRLHQQMPVQPEDLVQEFLAKTVHHGHHDDQRGDAEHDAEERKAGDDRNEAFLATRAQVTSGQQPFEGRKRRGSGCLVHGLIHYSIIPRFGPNVALLANITSALDILSRYLCHHFRRAEILARTVAAPLDLEFALGEALRPNQNLPGDADQVGGPELRAGALVGIVIEHVHTL